MLPLIQTVYFGSLLAIIGALFFDYRKKRKLVRHYFFTWLLFNLHPIFVGLLIELCFHAYSEDLQMFFGEYGIVGPAMFLMLFFGLLIGWLLHVVFSFYLVDVLIEE